jgi:hypothetical protein
LVNCPASSDPGKDVVKVFWENSVELHEACWHEARGRLTEVESGSEEPWPPNQEV